MGPAMIAGRGAFRIVVFLVVAVSFVYLFVRGRPLAGTRGIEPLLFASGLSQPRGLAFAAGGTLLVAEAGIAGDAAAPGRISGLNSSGERQVVVDGLSAAQPTQPLFAQSGPAALARGAPASGAGAYVALGPSPDASMGSLAALAGAQDTWQLTSLSDLGQALGQPAAGPAAVRGAVVGSDGTFYGLFPVANLFFRIAPDALSDALSDPGRLSAAPIARFVEAGQGNPFPTSVALAPDGAMFVTLFGTEPFRPRGGRVVRVERDGRWQVVFDGLTFPIAAAFDSGGRLYVLEFASGYDSAAGRFRPNSGRLITVGPAATRRRTVVPDVSYPTAIAFSDSGDVYFTENGVSSRGGDGRVLRVVEPALRRYR
jgi:hypothetical protein